MLIKELARYSKLNKLAEKGGTVIFGIGSDDMHIPISELVQAFEINTRFYNRSVEELSIRDAAEYYRAVIEPMSPQRMILHIGSYDLPLFKNNPDVFDKAYRELIEVIRKNNPKCNIGIVSLKNTQNDETIFRLNQHLCMLAEAETCEFQDISAPHVWNPLETKNAMSFASAMGLSKKFHDQKSLYDLAKIFFGYC